MFTNKSELLDLIDALRKQISNIRSELDKEGKDQSYLGAEGNLLTYRYGGGVKDDIKEIKKENLKLKSIVAELVDYVYKDNK